MTAIVVGLTVAVTVGSVAACALLAADRAGDDGHRGAREQDSAARCAPSPAEAAQVLMHSFGPFG